ncbi:hypothetical protein [Thermococcus barophilus]|uniref:Uncharacterized protein n=1 Tax=Thermococcus barophilus TaxID=55802 RepID=A0A0S1XAA6_THEBA|nr:hypothetical protein [Thermococcus barophilus]ALM74705.1 hypothetical protein TBCH5v1_0747 [Thermococcus barophilus]
MVEFEFELPLDHLNRVMDKAVKNNINIKWTYYNPRRHSFVIRMQTKEELLEKYLVEISDPLCPAEVSIIKDGKVSEAFLIGVDINGRKIPAVISMWYSENNFRPSKITVTMWESDFSDDAVKKFVEKIKEIKPQTALFQDIAIEGKEKEIIVLKLKFRNNKTG